MKYNYKAFTVVELLIYVFVSIIIIYGTFYVFHTISDIVKDSDKNVGVYQEFDHLNSDFHQLTGEYNKYFFSKGDVFSKSEYGFQTCVFANAAETKGLMVGVINKTTGNLTYGNIATVENYKVFMAEIGTSAINTIRSTDAVSNATLSGANIQFYDMNVLKFTCNKKSNYTKFDVVVAPDLKPKEFGQDLTRWTNDVHRKLSVSIIK